MAKGKALIGWIAHSDLQGLCHDRPEMIQVIAKWVGKLNPRDEPPGPVKIAIEQGSFTEVHLLTTYDDKVNKPCSDWLGCNSKTHKVTLPNPTDYKSVFEETDRVFRSLWGRFRKAHLDPCIILNPGTHAMATILVLLGKSRYPSTFCSTFKGKLEQVEIPFDLVIDFLPELLRNPDMYLQQRAAGGPGQMDGFEGIVGESPVMQVAIDRAQKVALRNVSVLILGESGTGKDMFARAIHKASPRRDGPFEAINCAAIPRELLESELFGHEKHAFTGADKAQFGAFTRANGGTLFLDEIGDCDPAMQAKLLRVLQPPADKGPSHREFTNVGGKHFTADVRVIAATNRDLFQGANGDHFRMDLFYRLAVFILRVPPLREREGDIPILAKTLLGRINQEFRQKDKGQPGYKIKSLAASAIAFVKNYPWPGNVRQLENALVQAAVMVEGEVIEQRDLAAAVGYTDARATVTVLERPLGDGFDLVQYIKDIQRFYLQRAMEQARGNKTKAAKLLGYKHYQTLDAQMDRLHVDWTKPDEL
jgi:DNA-binding NtrC family response regulator